MGADECKVRSDKCKVQNERATHRRLSTTSRIAVVDSADFV